MHRYEFIEKKITHKNQLATKIKEWYKFVSSYFYNQKISKEENYEVN